MSVSLLMLATNNQIQMMESSASRFTDVESSYVNLARAPLSEVESVLKKERKPDIILIMIPLIAELAEIQRILALSPKS